MISVPVIYGKLLLTAFLWGGHLRGGAGGDPACGTFQRFISEICCRFVFSDSAGW